jgi:hypothetical protein
MRHKSTCIVTFFCCFLTVFTRSLYAFGNLPADEVRSLFSEQTVEGEFREGGKKHIDPNSVSAFYEPFVMYFSEAGTVRSIRGEIKKTGKWWVDEKGNHCVQWKGKKKGCAPITKEGSTYKKYKMRSGAGGGSRIKWVKTFIKFSPGNPNNL